MNPRTMNTDQLAAELAQAGVRAENAFTLKIRIFDNGGKSFDRYTVIYPKQPHPRGPYYPYAAMSEHPTHPQGFGQHGELQPPGKTGFRHLGKKIPFDQLPPDCQKLVSLELREYEALDRLEYLRKELRNGTVSYGELVELQDLIPHIHPNDVELLEAAGVPEFTECAPKENTKC